MARKLNRREKIFVLSAGAAVILFFFLKWVAVPTLRFASGAPERIEEQRAVMLAYQAVVAREESLKEESLALDKVLAEAQGSLLPGETAPLAAAELQTQIKGLADRAGLDIVSEKVLRQKEREHFVEIPFQIVATGSIENFRDFIALVESTKTHIGISELNFRSLGRRQPARGAQRGRRPGGIQATMTVSGLVPAQGA